MKRISIFILAVVALLFWYFKPIPELTSDISASANIDPQHNLQQRTTDQSLPLPKQIKQCYAESTQIRTTISDFEQQVKKELVAAFEQGQLIEALLSYDSQNSLNNYQYSSMVFEAAGLYAGKELQVAQPEHAEQHVEQFNELAELGKKEIAEASVQQDTFQLFYPIAPLRIHGSYVFSYSLLLLNVALELPETEFAELIQGKRFYPHEIAHAIEVGLPAGHIALLVRNSITLQGVPAFYTLSNSPFGALNLADVAAARWRTDVLKLLKEQNIKPSSIEGMVTGLDYALFSSPATVGTDTQVQVVQYLIAEGYKTHLQPVEEDFYEVNSEFLSSRNLQDPELLALIKNQLISLSPYEKTQPPEALNVLFRSISEQGELLTVKRQECDQLEHQRKKHAELLSRDEILSLIRTSSSEPQGKVSLAELHQLDPALVDRYLTSFYPTERPRQDVEQSLITLAGDGYALQEFTARTALNGAETAVLLNIVSSNLALLPAWQFRKDPVAPMNLMAFYGKPAEFWLQLQQSKFDLHLLDSQDQNLYRMAFSSSVEAVELLIEQGVDPLGPQLGSDALDYVLDHSYINATLHPLLPKILHFVQQPEPSHLARMKRLQKFQPEMYQHIIRLKPELIPEDSQQMNKVLSSPRLSGPE